MTFTAGQIEKEVRRPVLSRYAKELGIGVEPSDNVTQIKEKLMANMSMTKTNTTMKLGAKAAPPPAKPAAKAVEAKPAPKAAPAPVKAAAPVAPPKPAGVTREEMDAFKNDVAGWLSNVTATLDAFAKRLDSYDRDAFGAYVVRGEDGEMALDIEHADHGTLRDWAWTFGVGDIDRNPESIRKDMLKRRAAADFDGWAIVNEGDTPEAAVAAEEEEEAPAPKPRAKKAVAAPVVEEAEEEAAAEEEESEGYTEEGILKMNPTELMQLAKDAGVPWEDCKKKPEVLRARILEELHRQQADAEAGEDGEEDNEEAEEAAEAADEGFVAGAAVVVNHDGEQHEAEFVSIDADGDFIVICAGLNPKAPYHVAAPADKVEAA